jgi:hypothetical protein
MYVIEGNIASKIIEERKFDFEQSYFRMYQRDTEELLEK